VGEQTILDETAHVLRQRCPVSLDLARQRVADLRRARLAETASSWLSH
jgi:hypothetical protein